MRLPTLPRRELVRALVAVGLTQNPLTLRPASAAYTVVPTGSVAEKRAALVEVEKRFAEKPEDPYVFGEKAQLEYDIGALERNAEFSKKISRAVSDGTAVLPTSLTIGVPDMDEAVTFWTRGVGALVLATRLDASGANVTRVGFGPQTLGAEDGAKFALELVEVAPQSVVNYAAETSVVQYVQLGISVFRLSQVMRFGGEIESAYGWTELRAPGGLPLRVKIDETRRDPFEFVALRTGDVKAAGRYYEGLGMTKVSEKDGRRKVKIGVGSYGIAMVNEEATEPDRESGAVQMSYGDPALSTGLLLLPPKKRSSTLLAGTPPATLRLAGKPATADVVSPDGFRLSFSAAGDTGSSLASLQTDGFEKGYAALR